MPTSWHLPEASSGLQDEEITRLSRVLSVSTPLVELLARRGIASADRIRKFLFPSLEDLQDPFLVPGMGNAVQIIRRHLVRGSRILIHGDYDVDGVTASALLVRALKKFSADCVTFIPNRFHDGYGFSEASIRFAREKEAGLIITADCGITALREIGEARSLGMDVVVTDHHQLSPRGLPNASAIVHPLLDSSRTDFKELSAVGLVFKLAQALLGEGACEFADLVALGTVADHAPLLGENRILVKHGLGILGKGLNPGLKAIALRAKSKAPFTCRDLGFVFGPRLNASGRMDSAGVSLQLLVSDSGRECESLAGLLEEENKRRQRVQKEVLEEAVRQVEREFNFNRDRVIVVWDRHWHPGVIGIVASRLVERYYRPSVVIAVDENGMGRGSARSIRHFNVFEALCQAGGMLVEYGGHEQAAGLKIESRHLDAFRRSLNETAHASMEPSILSRSYDVDGEIRLGGLSRKFLEELELLEPFGADNPKPVFLTRGLTLKGKPVPFGKDRLRFWVEDGETTAEAVGRRSAVLPWISDGPLDLIYTPGMRTWMGEFSLVLEVLNRYP